ncbi:hypothetical protein [Acidianus sp. RZ1]|uniref:hypothetical protein n=1 Tax=Acidianus sp. RZ1 TaxID=1540082 RepID=UPI0014912E58|nr:hypothetical protein [Acidianus sp. RZ1]NON63582.1 hypothetical protein [Acidianus sp. RZ1]
MLHLRRGTLISFFSSGFPSHVRGNAIDVSSPDMENFLSPIEGKVEKIIKVKIGRPNKFAKVNYDYVIYMETPQGKLKLLHVEPEVKEGEEVKIGSFVGKFLENPYTGGDFPHAHIEGIPIELPRIKKYDEEASAIVVNVSEFYFDVEFSKYAEAGELHGLGCCGGILNASLLYAGYAGIIGKEIISKEISILGIPFYVSKIGKNYTIVEAIQGLVENWEFGPSFKVLAGEPVYGKPIFESILSWGGKPRIRFFISSKYKEGDVVNVWRIIGSYMGRKV